jgi:2-(1,2-epoxy-1,2-dihydrophenyl)acetyl-CoA isomerase
VTPPNDSELAVTPGQVATVEIRRPPNNFFDTGLIRGLAEALESLAADHECRAVVLCSEGKHFCAGADFSGGQRQAGIQTEGTHLYDVAIRLFAQPLPIVAAVQGAAIGGGLGLALAADFRVACPEARFSANFARLGFHQGFGLSVTLPALVGQQRALEMLYTGRRLDGQEAARIGLCDRLVPLAEVRAAAGALAGEIAASAPLAVRSIRETMRGHLTVAVRDALVREKAEQDRLVQTEDWAEGIRAATQRVQPHFRGR